MRRAAYLNPDVPNGLGKFATIWLMLIFMSVSILNSSVALAAPRENWKLSCYAYRDVNRNGVFDMGDRPYGALPIKMHRPDGTFRTLRSNLDGFANFKVQFGETEDALIHEPGTYRVEALVPPGWDSTSEMDRQTLHMLRLPDAPGGMFVKDTCRPIGVAPILKIRGTFSVTENVPIDKFEVFLTDSDGKKFNVPHSKSGHFEFAGYPSEWLLEIQNDQGADVYSRRLELKDAAILLGQIDLAQPWLEKPESAIETVRFDDLTISDALFEIPSGYHGLNWLNWISVHNRFYLGAGYVNSTVSSEYVAYNSSGTPARIWSDEPFDFVGTYISVAWTRGSEKDVVVRAWRGDELVHEDRMRLTRAGPIYFAAGYQQITKLEFRSEIYERITLDDFSFRR